MRKKIYYEMAMPEMGTGIIVPYLRGAGWFSVCAAGVRYKLEIQA